MNLTRFAWSFVRSWKRMQRYDFYPYLQNFWRKSLQNVAILTVVHIYVAVNGGAHIIIYITSAISRHDITIRAHMPRMSIYVPCRHLYAFSRLHEAALRKNVADYGWRQLPHLCTATTRMHVECGCGKSFWTVDTQASDGLRQGRYARVHWRKGTWSQMPVMEWLLCRLRRAECSFSVSRID